MLGSKGFLFYYLLELNVKNQLGFVFDATKRSPEYHFVCRWLVFSLAFVAQDF